MESQNDPATTKPVPTKEENEENETEQSVDGKKKKEGGGKKSRGLKTPKGTRDYDPFQMSIREKVFSTITTCFKRHGAVTIETPIFELKETLTGKYGEDSKLIYDLQDQGGEICSLRYDLTVPFARYVAMNRIKQIKRYQIGRVYRRDNPVMNKGRYREFYQCDFDIAGEYDLMVPDAEAVKLITEILDALKVGNFKVKINHRKLLDGIFAICGVPEEKFRAICSAVDKLDKTPWEEVRKEMVEAKGLPEASADQIKSFVLLSGHPNELMKKLIDEKRCETNESAKRALHELGVLFEYVDCFGVLDKLQFDLSLARGLDYYTGVIYEAILTDPNQVGSIAGGGRYDNLVGVFGGQIPAVGFSIGVERVFTILEEKAKKSQDVRTTATDVMVASIDKGALKERMRICTELWNADIRAEFFHKENPKLPAQLAYADTNKIPFAVIFGQRELDQKTVNVKSLWKKEQETVPREKLTEVLKQKIAEFYASNNSGVSNNNN